VLEESGNEGIYAAAFFKNMASFLNIFFLHDKLIKQNKQKDYS